MSKKLDSDVIQFACSSARSFEYQGWAMQRNSDAGIQEGALRVTHGCEEALCGHVLLEQATTGAVFDSVGASRCVSPEMQAAVSIAIGELECTKEFTLDAAVAELVDLWVCFPLKPSERETCVRVAQIEHVTNLLMKDVGSTKK